MFDIILPPNATVNVNLIVSPTVVDKIVGAIREVATAINQGAAAMTAAQDRLTKEVQDMKDSNAQLVGAIMDTNGELATIAQALRDAQGDEAAMTKAADDLDALQTSNATLLAGLADPPATFVDMAAFTASVDAYKGPKTIALDGTAVKSGLPTTLAYFTHSADGHIDMTGPTD